MTLRIGVETDRPYEGIDVIRQRLGNSGNIRSSVTPILREGARLGAETARFAAPKGATGRLSDAIDDDAIVFRVSNDVVTARFGLQPVRNPGRGSSLYPLFVHSGTGVYGSLHRLISAKRAERMRFPDGGKPWPVTFGGTGTVVKRVVRGQRPQPFMTTGYEAAARYVEVHLDDLVERLIG